MRYSPIAFTRPLTDIGTLHSHPDKLQLEEGQTKEEADNHFVELTKAYKAYVLPHVSRPSHSDQNSLLRLTDEVSRHNFEMYGHPDGKQEFSQGIALPSWIVEGKNTPWVMGLYALVLGVALPLAVVRRVVLPSFSSLRSRLSFVGQMVVRRSQDYQRRCPQLYRVQVLPRSEGRDDLPSTPRYSRLFGRVCYRSSSRQAPQVPQQGCCRRIRPSHLDYSRRSGRQGGMGGLRNLVSGSEARSCLHRGVHASHPYQGCQAPPRSVSFPLPAQSFR